MDLVRCESFQEMDEAADDRKLNLMLHGGQGRLQSVSYNGKDTKIIQHDQPLLLDFINHEKHTFNVLGSCDGLLLVLATTDVSIFPSVGLVGHVIYIWNPTTGEYKTLPQLASHLKSNTVFGFGPDLTTDDDNHYKVLLLETVDGEDEISEFKVNIYTTYTNSWKTLLPNFGPYGYFTPHPRGMILVHNNLHYVAEIDTTEEEEDDLPVREFIISFDLKDDKFRVLPSPPGLLLEVCSMNAHLCAFSRTDDNYGLWKMENFGVNKQECWTKICSIEPRLAMDKPVTFLSAPHALEDGQILLYARPKPPLEGKTFIVSYNTENKKASFLAQGNGPFMCIPVVYEETSISPNAASTAGQLKP